MFSNLRFTPAITFVLHSFLALFVGALASALAAAGLAITQPNVNLSIVVGAGIAAFSAWFIHGFVALRNSPQFGQAEHDALAQGQARLTAIENSHAGLLDAFNSLYQQYQQYQQANNAKPVAASQAQPQTPLQGAYNLAANPAFTNVPQTAFPAVPLSASGVPLRYGDSLQMPAVPPRG